MGCGAAKEPNFAAFYGAKLCVHQEQPSVHRAELRRSIVDSQEGLRYVPHVVMLAKCEACGRRCEISTMWNASSKEAVVRPGRLLPFCALAACSPTRPVPLSAAREELASIARSCASHAEYADAALRAFGEQ